MADIEILGKNVVLCAAMGVALLFSSQAPAQTAESRGAYFGLAYGESEAHVDCSSVFYPCRTTDDAWKFLAGYRLNRHLAVEATYGDWGQVEATGSNGNVFARNRSASGGIAALGILPLLSDRVFSFAKAGVAYTHQKQTANFSYSVRFEDKSGVDLHLGAGAILRLVANASLRAEFEWLSDSRITVMSIGVQYGF